MPTAQKSRRAPTIADATVIAAGAGIVLLCLLRLSPPRMPLGLGALAALALAARRYPLTGDDRGPSTVARPPLAPLIPSTALLTAIALYGVPWATIVATVAAPLGALTIGRRGRGMPSLLALSRMAARAAISAALAGLLYASIAAGGMEVLAGGLPLIPALPALFVAQGALVCATWGPRLLRGVVWERALDATARRDMPEAVPALAAEPVLAFVLAGAVATGSPAAVLAAALPPIALFAGLRWHAALRRRLEEANAALGRSHALLQVQATTDPLTGLANRRRFEQALATRLAEAARYGRPLAVLVIDLDAFKSINDAHGHAYGDAVLAAVAGALRRGLRASDLPARLGGDEFVALLPETDTARALALAERVCAEIAALEVMVAAGGATVRPTASVGAAATPDHPGVDAAALLAAADRAAYAAKRAGKNRARLAA